LPADAARVSKREVRWIQFAAGQVGDGMKPNSLLVLALLQVSPVLAAGGNAGDDPPGGGQLADLSLELLGEIEITSVSRRAEKLSEAPASIYVIQAEDIARAGASTLPEALRLAPNLQVAQVSASSWAISARGFNNSLGNKLLVLIDGRTVYTPLFSGVFWDQQELLLEDVERIEVISGPGATLWGANAVNGVINVVTRHARDTEGLLAAASAGGDGNESVLRYGGRAGGMDYRVYARHLERRRTEDAADVAQPDGWHTDTIGFRADWGEGFTLQGDAYRGESEARLLGPIEVSGMNLLAAWNRHDDAGRSWHVQAYFDRSERDDPVLLHDRMDVFDVELQRSIPRGRHRIMWGGGLRHANDRVEAGFLAAFLPVERDLHWENLFVQDEIALSPRLQLTLGAKLDRNAYTGTEWLPSARLAWHPRDGQLLWAAASRAVRAPARIDKEFFLPPTPPFLIDGGPDFRSEIADVLEVGYRAQPSARASLSLTLFHHWYDRLRSGEPQPAGNFQVQNGTAGRVYGLEAWAAWDPTPNWRLSAGLMELRERFWTKAGYHDPDGAVDLGNDPRHQWSLRSTWQVTPRLEFNLGARTVGELPVPHIDAYTAVDASLRWRPGGNFEVGVFGRNLAGGGHVEFAPGPLVTASEYERSAMLRLQWHW
jgi:iron complex outermembrane receptor protein